MHLKLYKLISKDFTGLITKVSQKLNMNLWDAINDYILKEYKERVTVTTSNSTFSVYYEIKTGNTGAGTMNIRMSDHAISVDHGVKDINIVIPKNSKKTYIISYKSGVQYLYNYKETINFIKQCFYMKDTEAFVPQIDFNTKTIIKDIVNPSTGIPFKIDKELYKASKEKKDYSKMPLFGDWEDWTFEKLQQPNQWKAFIEWYKIHVFDIDYAEWDGGIKQQFKNCFNYSNMSFDEVQQHIAMNFSTFNGDEAQAVNSAKYAIQAASEAKAHALKNIADADAQVNEKIIDKDYVFFTKYVELPKEYDDYKYRNNHLKELRTEMSQMFPWLGDNGFTDVTNKRINAYINKLYGGKTGHGIEYMVACIMYTYNKKFQDKDKVNILDILNDAYNHYKNASASKIKEYFKNNIIVEQRIAEMKEPPKIEEEHPRQYSGHYEVPQVVVSNDEWLNIVENRKDTLKLESYLIQDVKCYKGMTPKQKNMIIEFCQNDIPYKDCIEIVNSSYWTTKSLEQGIKKYLKTMEELRYSSIYYTLNIC